MGIFNEHSETSITSKALQAGPPGVGFKLTDYHNNFDIQNRKLINVKDPSNNKDVVNKEYDYTHYLKLDSRTHMVGNLYLRGNKIILPGEIYMDHKLINNLDTDT